MISCQKLIPFFLFSILAQLSWANEYKDPFIVYAGFSQMKTSIDDGYSEMRGALADEAKAINSSVDTLFSNVVDNVKFRKARYIGSGPSGMPAETMRGLALEENDIYLAFLNLDDIYRFEDIIESRKGTMKKVTSWYFFSLMIVSSDDQKLLFYQPFLIDSNLGGEDVTVYSQAKSVIAQLKERISMDLVVDDLTMGMSRAFERRSEGGQHTYAATSVHFSNRAKRILRTPNATAEFSQSIATYYLSQSRPVIPAQDLSNNVGRAQEIALSHFHYSALGILGEARESFISGDIFIYPLVYPQPKFAIDLEIDLSEETLKSRKINDLVEYRAEVILWNGDQRSDRRASLQDWRPKKTAQLSDAKRAVVISRSLDGLLQTDRWTLGNPSRTVYEAQQSRIAAKPAPVVESPKDNSAISEQFKEVGDGELKHVAYALVPVVLTNGKEDKDIDPGRIVSGLNVSFQEQMDEAGLQGVQPSDIANELAKFDSRNFERTRLNELEQDLKRRARLNNGVDFLVTGTCTIDITEVDGGWRSNVTIDGVVHDTRRHWDFTRALTKNDVFTSFDTVSKTTALKLATDQTALRLANEKAISKIVSALIEEAKEGESLKIDLYFDKMSFAESVIKALSEKGKMSNVFNRGTNQFEFEYRSAELDRSTFAIPFMLSQQLGGIELDCVVNEGNVVIAPKSEPRHEAILGASGSDW